MHGPSSCIFAVSTESHDAAKVYSPREVIQLEHHQHSPWDSPQHVEYLQKKSFSSHDSVPDRFQLLLALSAKITHAASAFESGGGRLMLRRIRSVVEYCAPSNRCFKDGVLREIECLFRRSDEKRVHTRSSPMLPTNLAYFLRFLVVSGEAGAINDSQNLL